MFHPEDEDEWIVWLGGKCPVAPGVRVTAARRYAPVVTASADTLRWSHDLYNAYGADDIVAYRICADEDAGSLVLPE